MEEENYYNIITRYLDGTASPEEAGLLLGWLKSNKQNMDLFIEMKDLWGKSGLLNKNDLETELALQRFKNRLESKYRVTNNSRIVYKKLRDIAAILIIAILSGILLYTTLSKRAGILQMNFTETIIPFGQKGQVILSDGTKVSLNSGSKIKYPSNFNRNTREVFLEGEAYFEVSHDKNKPFLVHSGKLTVKVLGTSFNIKSYPNEKRIETTLVTGSIKILETNENRNIEVTTLKPNEQAIYNTVSGKISIKQFQTDKKEIKLTAPQKQFDKKIQSEEKLIPQVETVIMWKEQKLIFVDETLEQMVQKLTRWYGKKVLIESESLKNNKYSGKFIYNETIYQVLEVISLTTNLTYYEKNHEIYIKTK